MTLPVLTRIARSRVRAPLRPPFPWFGSKVRAASLIWSRFGRCANYVEPFFGCGAALLGRPDPKGPETICDRDGFVANFWRAAQDDPDSVALYADWPVNQADLSARHYWLVTEGRARLEQLATDPDWYDPKIAGWWAWARCCYVGTGWCHDNRRHNPKPQLRNAGQGLNRKQDIYWYLRQLSVRLRGVRVCCCDWTGVLTPSVTFKQGTTAVLLDPPYAKHLRNIRLYPTDEPEISDCARCWAIENGSNPRLRIALCGLEGEHQMPDDWTVETWTARAVCAEENRGKERIWFSPHCIQPKKRGAQCLLQSRPAS